MRNAWLRLDVEKGKRERLAELTGIPATNLSAMNTGRLPMTIDSARRIAAAVPGLSVLELGAPEAAADEEGTDLLRRLDELATVLAESLEEQAKTRRAVGRLRAQVRALEDQLGRRGAASTDPA